jgi:hypothetical protein
VFKDVHNVIPDNNSGKDIRPILVVVAVGSLRYISQSRYWIGWVPEKGVLGHLAGLHCQDCSPHIPVTLLGYSGSQLGGKGGCQAPGPDGKDDLAGGVGHQDHPAGGHILLHSSSRGMLGILGKLVPLSQQDHLELPLTLRV